MKSGFGGAADEAANHAERSCLGLAYAYDQATHWVERRPPPMLARSD